MTNRVKQGMVGGFGVVVLLLVQPALAQTTVSEGTYPSQVWTSAGSPYLVSGTVEFPALTIEAGVEVIAEYEVENLTQIRVTEFTVNGTLDSPVSLVSSEASALRGWVGVDANKATVAHAVMRNAQSGLTTRTEATIKSVLFELSEVGISPSGDASVDACTFIDVGIGVFNGYESSVTISNSLFLSSALDGIACNSGNCVVVNSTFDDGPFGIYAGGGWLTVRNSIFTNNGIAIYGGGGSITYSNFWSNDQDFSTEIDYDARSETAANLFVDPVYVAADDYRLSASSPCIDAGSAEGAPDHDLAGLPRPIDISDAAVGDGSGFDMGAYEYAEPSESGAGGAAGAGGERGGGSGAGGAGATSNTSSSDTTGVGAGTATGAVTTTGADTMTGASGGSSAAGSGGSSSTARGTSVTDAGSTEKAPRTSKGCGCRQHGAAPVYPLSWLVLFVGLGWLRRRRATTPVG